MNIEIVEFYPIERNEAKGLLNGTLRIKLPDIGIHILGIFVSKRKGSWFFSLPGRQGFDQKAEKKIRYPFVVFENRDQQKELMTAIREKMPAFIEKRLTDTESPLFFPNKQQQDQKQAESPKDCNNATVPKKTTATTKSKSLSSFANKDWRDPPSRPTKVKNASKFAKR